MTLAERIPGYDDAQLKSLRENALRLEQTGTPTQQAAAADLLPAIDAELETRLAAKPKPAPRKTPVRKKKAA